METKGLAQQAAEQVERLRTRAALSMVIASLAVGFLVGRASVWLVPFETRPSASFLRQSAAVGPEAKPAFQPVRPAEPSDAKASERTETIRPRLDQAGPAATPPATGEAGPKQSEAAPRDPTKGPTSAAVDTSRSPGTDERTGTPEPKAIRQGVTLLNPGSADAGPDAQGRGSSRRESGAGAQPNSPASVSAGSEECARRFSSFQPSDGTYQPYGGGPRARCPLLR